MDIVTPLETGEVLGAQSERFYVSLPKSILRTGTEILKWDEEENMKVLDYLDYLG